jgi:hypothetical protein
VKFKGSIFDVNNSLNVFESLNRKLSSFSILYGSYFEPSKGFGIGRNTNKNSAAISMPEIV